MASFVLVPPETQSLLTSNDPPLETQIQTIEDFILAGSTRLAALDDQIESQRACSTATVGLITERDALDQSVREHNAVLSPIRRIPTEILFHIFLLTLPHTKRVPGVMGRKQNIPAPPWRLGHVCKHWRDCALAYRRLWSTIHVDTVVTTSETYDVLALETQLSRSSYSLLHVSFRWPAYESGSHSRLCALARALVPSCDRWLTAKLSWTPDDHSMVEILSGIRGRLPVLKQIEFISCGHGDDPDECDVLTNTPSLREVILTDIKYNIPSLPISAPWAQITCLRANFGFRYLLKILRASPNLEDCGLSLVEGSSPPSVPTLLADLPRLRKLCVTDTRLLRCLTTPSLQYLGLLGGPLDDVLPFISRVGCRLAGLSAHHRCHSVSLILLLKSLPTLSSLSVDMNNDPLLTALTACDSLPVICPDLQSLSLSLDVPARTTTLSDMLESRWRTSPLKSVHVFDYSIPGIQVLPERLQMLKNQGLKIVLNRTVSFDPDMRLS
ncbi:hypothetical protein B0H16DRAFT_263173 [Mycena metata]|uniref:F-box domain-containing protein n=1 Tax=Mycena metata TaxID=1033252 RepID=A0AAD7HTD2_9AGAR|nr:hypothetical protein B0H16DRAFT_496048 [Mycena metata]KAJ7726764.1 hypothetical protein B0H16DRAFT_263173 [Mycena metata]